MIATDGDSESPGPAPRRGLFELVMGGALDELREQDRKQMKIVDKAVRTVRQSLNEAV